MMADHRTLKFSHARSHSIVMLYARSHFSARRAHRCFKFVVVSGLAPPVSENISGAKEASSNSHILSQIVLGWLMLTVAGNTVRGLGCIWIENTHTK